MVLAFRDIRRTIIVFLTILFSFSLFGCINITYAPLEPPVVRETEKINKVYELLTDHYYGVLDLNLEEINTVNELLSYTDPYTRIYTSGSMSIEKGETYDGLGITTTDDEKGILIINVNINSYYDRVFPGDIITKIDDINLEGLDYHDKAVHLKKELGTELTLTINRMGEEITEVLEIIEIPFNSVVYNKYGNVGYIRINRFSLTTFDCFNDALTNLEELGIEGLVIDVRDNGGGYLGAVYNILKLFLDGDEPLFYTYRPRENEYTDYMPSEGATRKPYPIAILTNQNSASASEMLSGVMQKHGYSIIGERTYGKDVYQVGLELPAMFGENKVLNITKGYWLLNRNESVNGGIYPDLFIYDSKINRIVQPVLKEEYKIGQVSSYIGVYQYLVSLTVAGNYIPTFLNEEFSLMIKEYQRNNDLPETGILDEETQKSLIIDYAEIKNAGLYDTLLDEALEYMETVINENRWY